jgi:predicted DNA-binding protein with PD1-like motif
MRNHIRLTLLLGLALQPVIAQQIRREVTRPANRAEDKRPNSSAVPSGYAISAQFQRVVLLRFKYDTDLLAGIESMVKQQGIKNAVILAGMGSVRNYQVHAVANRNFPSTDVFVRDPTGPADIIGMNGYVLGGRVHAHITLSTGDRAFGGHLEPNTNVFTFAVITLGVLKTDADLSRLDDQTFR